LHKFSIFVAKDGDNGAVGDTTAVGDETVVAGAKRVDLPLLGEGEAVDPYELSKL
jgi:hypothetical protein